MPYNMNLKNFTKHVFISIILIFHAYGGEMQNNNISLDNDKIIEVSIGNKVYKPTFDQEKGILNVIEQTRKQKDIMTKMCTHTVQLSST